MTTLIFNAVNGLSFVSKLLANTLGDLEYAWEFQPEESAEFLGYTVKDGEGNPLLLEEGGDLRTTDNLLADFEGGKISSLLVQNLGYCYPEYEQAAAAFNVQAKWEGEEIYVHVLKWGNGGRFLDFLGEHEWTCPEMEDVA